MEPLSKAKISRLKCSTLCGQGWNFYWANNTWAHRGDVDPTLLGWTSQRDSDGTNTFSHELMHLNQKFSQKFFFSITKIIHIPARFFKELQTNLRKKISLLFLCQNPDVCPCLAFCGLGLKKDSTLPRDGFQKMSRRQERRSVRVEYNISPHFCFLFGRKEMEIPNVPAWITRHSISFPCKIKARMWCSDISPTLGQWCPFAHLGGILSFPLV